MRLCLKCHAGALHAGKSDMNMSPWKGSMMCARCGEGASRLVGRHLCLSHYNRQQEVIRGFNAKHTAPKMHPPLHRRAVSFRTDGVVKTKTIEHTIGLEEVMFSVLRDEVKTVKFAWLADPATRALRDNPDLDFSISEGVAEVVLVADVAAVADGVQDAREQVVAPIMASPPADVAINPPQALRDAVEQKLDRDALALAPTASSRRAAKKLRQKARRQIRVSSVTVSLLRNVGALPAPTPGVVSVPRAQSSYSATLMSGGTAFG
jgi:hypothetical protein